MRHLETCKYHVSLFTDIRALEDVTVSINWSLVKVIPPVNGLIYWTVIWEEWIETETVGD